MGFFLVWSFLNEFPEFFMVRKRPLCFQTRLLATPTLIVSNRLTPIFLFAFMNFGFTDDSDLTAGYVSTKVFPCLSTLWVFFMDTVP